MGCRRSEMSRSPADAHPLELENLNIGLYIIIPAATYNCGIHTPKSHDDLRYYVLSI